MRRDAGRTISGRTIALAPGAIITSCQHNYHDGDQHIVPQATISVHVSSVPLVGCRISRGERHIVCPTRCAVDIEFLVCRKRHDWIFGRQPPGCSTDPEWLPMVIYLHDNDSLAVRRDAQVKSKSARLALRTNIQAEGLRLPRPQLNTVSRGSEV